MTDMVALILVGLLVLTCAGLYAVAGPLAVVGALGGGLLGNAICWLVVTVFD